MALIANGQGAYAPSTAVTTIIDAVRARGLGTPITLDVLVRAGITETLAPRTLASLKVLDLVDEDGHPTTQLTLLKEARGDEELKARLQEWVQGVYAEVLQYADPATDDVVRISEAFRGYKPDGQRARMTTLLLGLWQYAGLPVAETTSPKSAPRRAMRATSTRTPGAAKQRRTPPSGQTAAVPAVPAGLPPGLVGLIQQIPTDGKGWTKATRDTFLSAFTAVLDFTVPIRPDGLQDFTDDDIAASASEYLGGDG
jgi:hypothetical protein